MVLIFGGVYQGKLAYTQERFGSDKKIINNFDRDILSWVEAGEDVPEKIHRFIEDNKDSIVICNDISCGVVPIDPVLRKWREETGRALGQLAQYAEEVVRLFCGIPMKLK